MNFEEFIKKSLRVLNASRVKYVIIGGIAAIFYGRPRTTMDLDLIVLTKDEEIERLTNLLIENGFEVKVDEIRKALKEKTHATIFLKDSPYRIDLKGVYSSLDVASISKRRRVKLFGIPTWIERPEDVAIAKIVYGSETDLNDAKAILLRQKLDKKYLFERAKDEKITDKLKKLIT
jgi:precorrin-6B methylase 1